MKTSTIVGITGGSGSGKTTFVNQLIKELPSVTLLSMDNYYKDRSKQPKDDQGIENFDLPESINLDDFKKNIYSLINGDEVQVSQYTYNLDKGSKKTLVLKPARIIIVEGVFPFISEEIRSLFHLKIFIEAPSYLMLKRRIIRDAEERGYNLEDVLYRFENHVMPSFEKYILPSKKWADLVIPNYENFNKGLSVVGTFLNHVNH